jgi:hypothetical protein
MRDENLDRSSRWFGLLTLATAVAVGLSGCTEVRWDPEIGSNAPTVAELEGEFHVTVVDHEDLSTERAYSLALADGREIGLVFDEAPTLPGGLHLRVTGEKVDATTWHVTSVEVIGAGGSGIDTVQQDVTGATPEPVKQVAFVLLNFGTPDTSLTVDQAQQKIFSSSTSLKAYYQEDSYGIRNIDGKVLGPFTVSPMTDCNLGSGGGLQGLTDQTAAAMRAAGEDPTKYQHVLHYFPRTTLCAWAGLAYQPGNKAWYNGSSSGSVFAHELGHNFFLYHASSYACKDAAGNPVPFSASCTSSEYGDRFDPMGQAYRQSNAYGKAQQGWFAKCNLVTVSANGTFDLVPTELPSNGIQALRVVRDLNSPKTSSYYVEYRQPLGAFDNFASTDPAVNGLLIHVAPVPTMREHPFLLDMVPSTSSVADAALGVGQTFTDPNGTVKITLVSRSSASAKVKFEFPSGASGDGVCLDGTHVSGGGPCVAESDTELCGRLAKNCGQVTGTDNCGNARTVTSCGTCSSPQTCGGGGTANVCGGGSVDRSEGGAASGTGTSCNSTTENVTKAYDNLMTSSSFSKWCVFAAPTATTPVSTMYDFSGTTAFAITRYTVTTGNDVPGRDPKDWTLQGCQGTCVVGSDTGWVTLDTRTGQFAGAARFQTSSYSFANTTAFQQYRLRITANNGDSITQLAEIQLFE